MFGVARGGQWRELLASLRLGIVRHAPGTVGTRLRWRYYKRRLGALGEGTVIDENVIIKCAPLVFIGRNCFIGANTVIHAGPPLEEPTMARRANDDFAHNEGELHIGDHVSIGPHSLLIAHAGVAVEDRVALSSNIKLYSTTIHYRDPSGPRGVPAYGSGQPGDDAQRAVIASPIVVRENCLVGTGATILPGVTMGPRTWLGAGALARRRLEPDRVYAAPGIEGQPIG